MNEALIVPCSEADHASPDPSLYGFINRVVENLARLRVELPIMVEIRDT